MKYVISFLTILIFLSCGDEKIYLNKFDEFIHQSDTLLKLDNSTYNSVVDSLTVRLSNYTKIKLDVDSLGVVKHVSFNMITSVESSRIYYVTITLYKNNKLAFENYANRIVSFFDDPI